MVGTARIGQAGDGRPQAGGPCRLQPPTSGLQRHLTLHASRFTLHVFFAVLLYGCGEPGVYAPPPPPRQVIERRATVEPTTTAAATPAGFAPAKINILPLTELSGSARNGAEATLKIYVTLLDEFGSPIKAPGVVRFELYEYIQRSAQPKGSRLTLWPDIDLTAPAQNHKYWRDFLRAYEFVLDARAARDHTYILEATYLCPDGRRLSGEFTLKPRP